MSRSTESYGSGLVNLGGSGIILSQREDHARRVRLAEHLDDWMQCRRCPLGERAYKHVSHKVLNYTGSRRRSLLVDVLLVGEGPGRSEDALGEPFVGRSGRFLRNDCLRRADPSGLTVMLANLVACRPQDRASGEDRTPLEEEINTCNPRLRELLQIFDPLVVIALGRVPQDHVPATMQEAACNACYFHAPHPAAVARRGGKDAEDFDIYVIKFSEAFMAARHEKERLGR